jgi:hypothetical protein
MDTNDIAEFLTSRRARITPEQAGLPTYGKRRLRSEAGRHQYDRGLSDLVGELSTRSAEFRTRWAAHNMRFHRTGTKRLHHPVVGDLDLSYETMELAADAGLNLTVYTAEAGSASQQALDILASWTATPDEADTAGGGWAHPALQPEARRRLGKA